MRATTVSGPHLEAVALGVDAEVLDQVVARDPAAEAAWDAEARQAGEKPRRVQPQPVVARPPRSARLRSRLEDERLEPALAQQRGGRETGRAGPDDDDLPRFHAGVLPPAASDPAPWALSLR